MEPNEIRERTLALGAAVVEYETLCAHPNTTLAERVLKRHELELMKTALRDITPKHQTILATMRGACDDTRI